MSGASLQLAFQAGQVAPWELDFTAGTARSYGLYDTILGFAESRREWRPADYRQHVLPEHREQFDEALAQALETGAFDLEMPVRRADGAVRWIHGCGRVQRDQEGRPLRLAGVMSDITDRKRAEEQQEEHLEILSDAAAVLLGPGSPHELVRELFRMISDRLALDLCFNYSLAEEAQQLRLVAHAGLSDEDARQIERLQLGEAVCGTVAVTGRPYYAAGVQQSDDPRVSLIKEYGIRAYACQPLTAGGRVIGTISFGRCTRNEFRDEELAFFETISHHVAVATERWRVEQELRASEARFRGTFENAAVGIAHVGLDGHWIRVNERLCEITGYDREVLLQKTFQDITHPDDLEDDLHRLNQLLRGEIEHYEMEKRYIQPDDEAVWVNLTVALERSAAGAPLYFISIIEDISERKCAEAALRESEQRIRNIADTAPAMLWITDTDNACTFLNRRWYEYTGQAEAEGLGFGWLQAIHPEDRMRTEKAFHEAARSRRPASVEYRLRKRDGSYRWVLDKGRPWFDEDGEWLGYVGSVLDVHESKLAAEAVRESEARYRTLFESIREGFCVVEMIFDDAGTAVDYRFVEANPTFEQHTGLVDPVGKTARELVPGLEDYWIERYGQVARTGVPEHFELPSEALDDRWFDVQAFQVGKPENHHVALLFEDITEKRAAKKQLEELNEELEARVEERTQQVRALVSKLTRAEQEERRRISRILHDDLQQILYAVDMQMTMLEGRLDETEPAALAGDLGAMHERIERAITMTRQLTVDISPPILQKKGLADILEWLQRQMSDLHGLEVTVDAERHFRIPDEDLRVLLFQTVRELLFNVKKHAGVDRATVAIAEEDGNLVIHVIDEGDGFDVEEELEGEDEAGGFGLFSARERLRLAGGQLDVRSRPGEGTHMKIHAPASVNPAA